MASERDQGRAERILLAASNLRVKMDENPKHPNQDAWQARMDEYSLSLERLAAGLPERPQVASAENAVKIDVPAKVFALTAEEAERKFNPAVSALSAVKE